MYKTTNMIIKNPIYLLSKNNATAVFPYKEATQKIVNEYSQKVDLRPISNNQVITVLGNEIKTLEKPKRATKK